MNQDDVNKTSILKYTPINFIETGDWITKLSAFLFYNNSIKSKIVRLNKIIQKQSNSFITTHKISYEFIKEINELKMFFAENYEDLSYNDKIFLRSIFLNETHDRSNVNSNFYYFHLSDDMLISELHRYSHSEDLKYILYTFSYFKEERRLYCNFIKHVLFINVNKTIFQIDFNYLIKLLIRLKSFHVFPDEDHLVYNI